MIQIIFYALWILRALCDLNFNTIAYYVVSSIGPPLVSNLGEDTFRSGEVIVAIGNQSQYDFFVPFSSPLVSSPAKLALSMVDYNQTMDASNKIFYHLY